MSDRSSRTALPDLLPAILATVAVMGVSILLPGSFWIMDEAINYLQIEAVLQDPFHPPPAISAPGLDSAGEMAGSLRPLPHHYGFMRDGRLYAQYSPILAYAALPFRLLFGRTGSYALPALSLGLIVFLLGRILRERGFGRGASGMLLVLCTPLLFYGMTLWGHLPAAALCSGAWEMHRRGRFVPSAILLLAACLLREECLVFLPFLLLGAGRRKLPTAAAVGVLFVAVFISVQKLLTGSWSGTHLQASGSETDLYGYASLGLLERKAMVLRTLLLSCLPVAGPLASSMAGAALWLAWAFSRGGSRAGRIMTIAGPAISAALAVLAADGFRLFSLFELKHPLVVFPVLWLAGKPSRGWIVPVAALSLTLLAMEPMHALDAAWGTRLLIPATLMFAVSSARPGRATWVAVASGIVIASVSMGFLVSKRTRSAALVEAAGREGGAVIATSWEIPCEFAALQADGTPVLFADSTAEFARALEILGPLSPVVASPVEGVTAAVRTAAMLDIDLVPVFSVRFDPALEVVVLSSAAQRDADP